MQLLITYPGKGDKVISFVGSHMDVVPANPEVRRDASDMIDTTRIERR